MSDHYTFENVATIVPPPSNSHTKTSTMPTVDHHEALSVLDLLNKVTKVRIKI